MAKPKPAAVDPAAAPAPAPTAAPPTPPVAPAASPVDVAPPAPDPVAPPVVAADAGPGYTQPPAVDIAGDGTGATPDPAPEADAPADAAEGAFCPHCGSLIELPDTFNPESTVRPIRITRSCLLGDTWVAAGAILSVPDRRAAQLVALGHAEFVASAPPAADAPDPHAQAVETATAPRAPQKAARR